MRIAPKVSVLVNADAIRITRPKRSIGVFTPLRIDEVATCTLVPGSQRQKQPPDLVSSGPTELLKLLPTRTSGNPALVVISEIQMTDPEQRLQCPQIEQRPLPAKDVAAAAMRRKRCDVTKP